MFLALVGLYGTVNVVGCNNHKPIEIKEKPVITQEANESIDTPVLDSVQMYFVNTKKDKELVRQLRDAARDWGEDLIDERGIYPLLSVAARDLGENSGLAGLILYRDGNQIYNSKLEGKEGLYTELFMEYYPGRHKYLVYVYDKDNKVTGSRYIITDFGRVGKELASSYLDIVGGAITLTTSETGIEKILLYEDRKVVGEFDSGTKASYPLNSEKTGKFIYFAELVNLLGDSIITAPISVTRR